MFQFGNPGLFPIGNPNVFELLGQQCWFHKWLPDPPPEQRDAMLLVYIYVLGGMLSEPTDRADLQGAVATLLTKHAAPAPPPQPPASEGPTYSAPPRAAVTRFNPDDATLTYPGDILVVNYTVVGTIPPEGGTLGLQLWSPSGVISGSSPALSFTDYRPVASTELHGSIELVRGSDPLEPGIWRLGMTMTNWYSMDETFFPFAIAAPKTAPAETPPGEAVPEETAPPETASPGEV